MLRVEVKNSQTPIENKPRWIRTTATMGPEYRDMRNRMVNAELHTVCQEAGCPNVFECWEDREATFLIGGDKCTRRCDFCQINSAKPEGYDADEPRRVAQSVAQMGLRYATVTSVCRDDLPDEGAWLCAETIRQIHDTNPGVGVEMLAQDFSGKPELLDVVFEAGPEVFGHNLETVPRLFKRIRPGFRYERSLEALNRAHDAGLITKSNLILGMGETREEVSEAMADLLHSVLRKGDVIGIDCGRTMTRIAPYLHDLPRCDVVQLTGLAGGLTSNGADLTRRITEVTGGKSWPLYAPYVVADARTPHLPTPRS